MFAGHVVEGGGIEYVWVANDGRRSGGEVAGVLLDDGVIVVKGKVDPDAKCKKSGSEASDAAECIDGSDLWWEGWSGTDSDPDVWVGDVKEAKACRIEAEEQIEWESGGGRG